MLIPVHIIADQELGGLTAYVPDIPGSGEGETEAEAIEALKEALRLFIEVEGIQEAISRIRPRATVRELDLDLTELARG